MMKSEQIGYEGNCPPLTKLRPTKPADPAVGTKPEDQKLFDAILRGDEKAFADYYLKFIDSYVKFIRGIVLDEEEAREIAQDVFAYLWENRATIDPKKNLEAYLFGMAKNKAFNLIRSRTIHSKFHTEQLFTADTFDVEADGYVISKETELILKRVLKNMPQQRRRVFEMSRIDGMTHEEIARELGISRHTVHNHLTLALKEVREAITVFILVLLINQ